MSKKAALVLSGGSALGLAHIGAIEILEKHGYTFDAIYGVSAGSIVGACLAKGMNSREIYNAFQESDFMDLAQDFSLSNVGFIRGDKTQKFLNNFFEQKTIDELPVYLSIGATDFRTGEYIQITKGLVGDAVRSSISLPIIFDPFYHPEYKRQLSDGGLVRNLPLQEAVEQYKGDTIIAINVHALRELEEDFFKKKLFGWKKDIFKYLRHSYKIMVHSQISSVQDPRVKMIIPELQNVTAFTVSKTKLEQIVVAGRMAAQKFISENR